MKKSIELQKENFGKIQAKLEIKQNIFIGKNKYKYNPNYFVILQESQQ